MLYRVVPHDVLGVEEVGDGRVRDPQLPVGLSQAPLRPWEENLTLASGNEKKFQLSTLKPICHCHCQTKTLFILFSNIFTFSILDAFLTTENLNRVKLLFPRDHFLVIFKRQSWYDLEPSFVYLNSALFSPAWAKCFWFEDIWNSLRQRTRTSSSSLLAFITSFRDCTSASILSSLSCDKHFQIKTTMCKKIIIL